LTFGVEVDIAVDPFKSDVDPPLIPDQTLPCDLTLKCGSESFACHKVNGLKESS
jgi:hypothetical protein